MLAINPTIGLAISIIIPIIGCIAYIISGKSKFFFDSLILGFIVTLILCPVTFKFDPVIFRDPVIFCLAVFIVIFVLLAIFQLKKMLNQKYE